MCLITRFYGKLRLAAQNEIASYVYEVYIYIYMQTSKKAK